MDYKNFFEYRNNFDRYSNVSSKLIFGGGSFEEPLVSIVIPTYKRSKFLREAILSALNQKEFDDYEIIVLDNDAKSSNDSDAIKEAKKINDSKIYYYKNEKNIGMAGNWNRGIELSNGKWITILHDDDLLASDFLNIMVDYINNFNKIELLACKAFRDLEKFKNSIRKNSSKLKKINLKRLLKKNITPFPGVLFLKKNALELGGFNEDFYPIMDYVFWSEYCLEFNGYLLNQKLSLWRPEVSVSNNLETKFLSLDKTLEFHNFLYRNYSSTNIFDYLLKIQYPNLRINNFKKIIKKESSKDKLKTILDKNEVNLLTKSYMIYFINKLVYKFIYKN